MRLNSSLCERLWAVEIGHCTDARPHGLVLGWQARKYWPLHSDGSGNTRRGTSRYILKKRQRAAESPRGQEHMSNWHLFTSESVSEGHPDKVAAQISDAILDALLAQDKKARVACEALVLSTQHKPDISQASLVEAVIEEIIKPVMPEEWLSKDTKYFVNPTGRFVIGGPVGDCGLTGRKIIVDTYGGMARHGGGAFSGKDPSKVDRSAAYAGRYVAKNIVAAGIADRCEIQVSYAIGVAEPTSIAVDTFGTGKISEARVIELIREIFDLRPRGIVTMLNLLQPIYRQTASYGHFGREDIDVPWERTDKAEALRKAAMKIKYPPLSSRGAAAESPPGSRKAAP